jgi:hypothetical protein
MWKMGSGAGNNMEDIRVISFEKEISQMSKRAEASHAHALQGEPVIRANASSANHRTHLLAFASLSVTWS